MIHANKEGVIKIPETCVEALPERAAAMRAYEHENHAHLRRTDLDPAAKQRMAAERRERYGFLKGAR